MRRLTLAIAAGAFLSAGIALAQQGTPDANDDMGAAARGERKPGTPPAAGKPAPPPAPGPVGQQPGRGGGNRGGGDSADRVNATRAFLGLGVAPDAAAAKRGAPAYAQNCAACHGPDARGGIGPNLLYSSLLLDDDHGEKTVPFLRVGRPEKGMPPFAQLGDATLVDITEFLHLQVENYANRGTYQNTNNLLVGDAKAGASYFAANCTTCHSITGDLKGVGGKFRPLDLQRNMIFPSRENHPSRAIHATIAGKGVNAQGIVTHIDDFDITITDATGGSHTFSRAGLTVTLSDPLEWHKVLAYRLKDKEMTDLVTYLSTQK